jgi:hypothetical protein
MPLGTAYALICKIVFDVVPRLSTDTPPATNGMRESVGLECAPVNKADKREGKGCLLNSTGIANILKTLLLYHSHELLFGPHKER